MRVALLKSMGGVWLDSHACPWLSALRVFTLNAHSLHTLHLPPLPSAGATLLLLAPLRLHTLTLAASSVENGEVCFEFACVHLASLSLIYDTYFSLLFAAAISTMFIHLASATLSLFHF